MRRAAICASWKGVWRASPFTITPGDTALAVDGRPLEVIGNTTPGRVTLVAGTREPGRPERPPALAFDLFLDPGRHIFVLSRPGASDKVSELTFAVGATQHLALTGPPREAESHVVEAERRNTRDIEDGGLSALRIGAYVGIGVGIVGGVLGTASLIQSGSTRGDADNARADADRAYTACGRLTCSASTYDATVSPLDAQADELDAQADTERTFAIVSFMIGGISAAAGVTLLVMDLNRGKQFKMEPARRVSPVVALGYVGLTGQF